MVKVTSPRLSIVLMIVFLVFSSCVFVVETEEWRGLGSLHERGEADILITLLSSGDCQGSVFFSAAKETLAASTL